MKLPKTEDGDADVVSAGAEVMALVDRNDKKI